MPQRTQPVAITSAALRSALGSSWHTHREALSQSQCGLSAHHPWGTWHEGPLGVLCDAVAPWEGSPLLGLFRSLLQELFDTSSLWTRHNSKDIGFFVGTTTAGVELAWPKLGKWRQTALGGDLGDWTDVLTVSHTPAVLLKAFSALSPQHRGPQQVLTTACSSAAMATLEALWALRTGRISAAIVGGIDVLTPMTLAGFRALQILDEKRCRPFSADRQGINLGEAGAFFVLERMDSVPSTPPLGWLWGGAANSDAHHITQPDPKGLAMSAAMTEALTSAGIFPSDIGGVNAHGTGTWANDLAEATAIENVFSQEIAEKKLGVVSTKSLHGHTLGAAGALEMALSLMCLQDDTLYPGRQEIAVADEWKSLVLTRPKALHGKAILSNSFGFGGSNACLIFGPKADKGGQI